MPVLVLAVPSFCSEVNAPTNGRQAQQNLEGRDYQSVSRPRTDSSTLALRGVWRKFSERLWVS